MTTIAMLGLGSMNGAILAGLLADQVNPSDVIVTNRSVASTQAAEQTYGVRGLAEETTPDANSQAVAEADVVFLGVKPYQIKDLCAAIRDALKPDAVVVSVAAAVTLEMMESALRDGQPVIRAMPNTPLSVSLGVVGLAPGAAVTSEQVATVSELLQASGSVHVLPEDQIDALSAISGSGPAYAFYLAEHMSAVGVELGLDPDLAADLAAETVYGAGRMLVQNRGAVEAGELRRNVTSPNGTTEQAIKTFDDAGMGETIRTGAQAAAKRAAEITKGL